MKVSLARGVVRFGLILTASLAMACINPQPLPPGRRDGVAPAKEFRRAAACTPDAGACGDGEPRVPSTSHPVR